MSREAVVEFSAKADADESLRRRLRASAEGPQDECCRTVVALAADLGYQFMHEELLTTMRWICQQAGGELTDGDLEAVARGLDVPDPPGGCSGDGAHVRIGRSGRAGVRCPGNPTTAVT